MTNRLKRLGENTVSEIDIHQAARDGNRRAVKDYLARGGSANAIDSTDCEPLYYAVREDRLAIARVLLKAGGNIHRESRLRGDPLGAAVWNLNRRMVEFVLSAGVDINRTLNGETALDSLQKLRTCVLGPRGTPFPREEEAKELHRLLVSRGAVFSRYKPS